MSKSKIRFFSKQFEFKNCRICGREFCTCTKFFSFKCQTFWLSWRMSCSKWKFIHTFMRWSNAKVNTVRVNTWWNSMHRKANNEPSQHTKNNENKNSTMLDFYLTTNDWSIPKIPLISMGLFLCQMSISKLMEQNIFGLMCVRVQFHDNTPNAKKEPRWWAHAKLHASHSMGFSHSI